MEKLQECLVKGVLSGDTVILSGKIKKNSDEAPEEKNLYLSLLSAPRCGSSNNLEEEPFAWNSRDFLRQHVLGKVIKYTIDYKNNERQYGQIYFEGKNINLDLVKNGYAKIGFVPKSEAVSKGEYHSKLQAAEGEAKKAKLNIWSDDLDSARRKLHTVTDLQTESAEILKFTAGKEVDVMVDYVINCASYVVLIKELNTFIKMNLRFVGIPNVKETSIYKSGKAYAERIVLHKDVKAIIHGTDGEKNFIGDIIDKKGSMASNVIKNGYSRLFINNNTTYSSDELNTMKLAQKSAKKEKLRIWKNEKDSDDEGGFQVGANGTATGSKKSGLTDFDGVCMQVHSGDSISVKNPTTNEVLRLFLSHLKSPKLARPQTEEVDQPWAWQAKEFLRKIIVGKKLRCEFDYSKTIEKDDKKMNFYSVFRPIESNKKSTTTTTTITETTIEKNINVELIEQGLATYIPPRLDDDTSKYLDSYQEAEKTAKDKKVGIHSIKYPGNPNYSDLIAANKTKKKESINFLVNQKNLHCVVEYCFSGSKFKLRVEKGKSYIPFSLIGIKTFTKDKNTVDVHEKYYKQALDYANDHILQREGVCDIIQADRVGNYFGYLTINNANFATTILKEGLGVISVQSNTPIIHMTEFKNAEKAATNANKNIWSVNNLASFLKDGELVSSSTSNKFEEVNKDITIRVTDYIDLNNFFINVLPNKNINTIEQVLEGYENNTIKPTPLEFPVKIGTLCAARYEVDNKIYRAKILRALKDGRFEVEFLDYGTMDYCGKNDLMKLDNSIAMIEPQAMFCELAYLKYSQNSMKRSLELITDFVNVDLQLPAKICYSYNKDGVSKLGLVVYSKKEKKFENTHHARLLKVGYAKFDVKRKLPESIAALREYEKKAETAAIGLWADNEVADYDEEDEENY